MYSKYDNSYLFVDSVECYSETDKPLSETENCKFSNLKFFINIIQAVKIEYDRCIVA